MRPLRAGAFVRAALVVVYAAVIVDGCAAGTDPLGSTSSAGGAIATTTASSTAATGGAMSSAVEGGQGGGITLGRPDAGDVGDSMDEPVTNPCGSECGPKELCDEAHLGLDDDCNGLVDEGCSCTAGQAHSCFKGDPAYHNAPGCYDGTELCTEQGDWGPCIGGVHAVAPDFCFHDDTSSCHAISAQPYALVHLKTGTGSFGMDPLLVSESFTVSCPSGVSQCPSVTAPDAYLPLQSGEYTVTYTKKVQSDPNPKTCTFPLFVGASGLRVELSWEHVANDDGVDLDLHLHAPVSTEPWGVTPGVPQDCAWSNCVFSFFVPPQSTTSPHWFPDANMEPDPVNWYKDPIVDNNTCYNDPRSIGALWKMLGMGCHDPRLDVDDVYCDFSVTDPNDPNFCTPENINVDYPPKGEWLRVGVHYYNNHGHKYDVHPEIKIFCDGSLAADLGPQGYFAPAARVTFQPTDGAGTGIGNLFWMVADVAFTNDSCGRTTCVVKPIYADPTMQTPFMTTDTTAKMIFDPPWPPPP